MVAAENIVLHQYETLSCSYLAKLVATNQYDHSSGGRYVQSATFQVLQSLSVGSEPNGYVR